jgi:hypothetical protein
MPDPPVVRSAACCIITYFAHTFDMANRISRGGVVCNGSPNDFVFTKCNESVARIQLPSIAELCGYVDMCRIDMSVIFFMRRHYTNLSPLIHRRNRVIHPYPPVYPQSYPQKFAALGINGSTNRGNPGLSRGVCPHRPSLQAGFFRALTEAMTILYHFLQEGA